MRYNKNRYFIIIADGFSVITHLPQVLYTVRSEQPHPSWLTIRCVSSLGDNPGY